ncbi:hypothetical protein KJN74_04750 [Candidatus Bathyarchaeota archaeon]|nr:hypothetical protein [Candidatus Bathyarchaeota archaeon]
MKNKVAAVVLFVLILIITSLTLNTNLALGSQTQKQKAETLMSIIDENNMSIILVFSKLDEQSIAVPEAQNTYNEGLLHVNKAVNLMTQEEFTKASEEAIVAMQKFEETLKLTETALHMDPTGFEATTEEAINLKANITRTIKYVEQLERLTTKASEAGYNTFVIEKRLGEIKLHLETATKKLRTLDLEKATEQLSIAKTFIDELTEYVARLTNLVTTTNTERYLQIAEVRVSEAKANITLSTTLTPEAKEDALTALNNSEVSLTTARDLIEDSNVDDAIEELEEAKRWEEESDNAISPVAVAPSVVSATDTNLSNTEAMDSN